MNSVHPDDWKFLGWVLIAMLGMIAIAYLSRAKLNLCLGYCPNAQQEVQREPG